MHVVPPWFIGRNEHMQVATGGTHQAKMNDVLNLNMRMKRKKKYFGISLAED